MKWDIQANQGKGEEGLVDSADHDTNLLVPVLHVTHMGEGGTHVVREQGPTQSPQDEEKSIDSEVEARIEADAAVEQHGEGERCDGE
jgi:hypothetical protein